MAIPIELWQKAFYSINNIPKNIKLNWKYLLENHMIAVTPYIDSNGKFKMSNCLGTSLFLHGIKNRNRPIYVPKSFENNFTDEFFDSVRKPGSILYIQKLMILNIFIQGL